RERDLELQGEGVAVEVRRDETVVGVADGAREGRVGGDVDEAQEVPGRELLTLGGRVREVGRADYRAGTGEGTDGAAQSVLPVAADQVEAGKEGVPGDPHVQHLRRDAARRGLYFGALVDRAGEGLIEGECQGSSCGQLQR